MKIAVIGYGGVGKAFIKLMSNKKTELLNEGYNFSINCIMNSSGGIYNPFGIDCEDLANFTEKNNNICNFKYGWDFELTFQKMIDNYDIDVIIELTPTDIKTGGCGMIHIKEALSKGIHVITANKGPILLKYNELNKLAIKNNVQLAIGCTTGGALPCINAGIFDMAGSEIKLIQGILNGTTNFILKEMEDNFLSYEEALKKAQNLGIAETNPKLDVEGFDTASKLLILTNVLMNENKTLKDISIQGIKNITLNDIKVAKEEGKKYKLIGKSIKFDDNIKMSVALQKIDATHPLYMVDSKNKGVRFVSDTLGDLTLLGGASGVIPAAAAILRDLINISRGYRFSK